MKDIAIHHSE